MPIRHYGFLANRCRECNLAQIRVALALPAAHHVEPPPGADTSHPSYPGPKCRRGRLRILASRLAVRTAAAARFRWRDR